MQVLGFASRLADARREVADCQRALIRLQQATVATAVPPQSTQHKDNDDRTPRRRQRLQVTTTITSRCISPLAAHCCHMGTAIKHPVPDRVKPSFVIFDIRALWRSGLSVRVPRCQKFKWRLNPVWHRMLYSCTNMATVGVKGLNVCFTILINNAATKLDDARCIVKYCPRPRLGNYSLVKICFKLCAKISYLYRRDFITARGRQPICWRFGDISIRNEGRKEFPAQAASWRWNPAQCTLLHELGVVGARETI